MTRSPKPLAALFVLLLSHVLAGCDRLSGGSCSSLTVVVDGGTDALQPDGATVASPACPALCGQDYYRVCRLKDPTHVVCAAPCE